MKTLLPLLLLTTSLALAQKPGQLMVAVRNDENVASSSKGWKVETGEIYRFIRYISKQEIDGRAHSSADQSFSILQVGKTTITARSDDFRIVPENDIARAAMTYKKEVDENAASMEEEPVLLHSQFSDPKLERRYQQIYQEIRAKGETPTNEKIFAVMEKEADTQEALDLLREIRDSLR